MTPEYAKRPKLIASLTMKVGKMSQNRQKFEVWNSLTLSIVRLMVEEENERLFWRVKIYIDYGIICLAFSQILVGITLIFC